MMGCSRDMWPGRRGMCRLPVWHTASLLLSDAGLVTECADMLQRQSCCKTTGLVHLAAPINPSTMHAGDQDGARCAPPHPQRGSSARSALPWCHPAVLYVGAARGVIVW